MCGLFGWHGRLTLREREVLSGVLSYANVSRGKDSWGFAGSHNRRTWEVKRGLGKVPKEARVMAQYRNLMGHTRHATKGGVSLRNAHPFRRGNVVLSHNGAVWNYESLKSSEPSAPQVDSELLALRLGEDRDISDLDGYGVLTWIDLRTGEALVCQPSGRGEISLANIHGSGASDVRACVYSSEDEPLEAALKAAGLAYTLLEGEAGKVYTMTAAGVFESVREKLAWRKEEKTPLYAVHGGWAQTAQAASKASKAPDAPVHVSQGDAKLVPSRTYTERQATLDALEAWEGVGGDENRYRDWLRKYCADQYGISEGEIADYVSDASPGLRER